MGTITVTPEVTWITGASSGMGRAVARTLATPARHLVLTGRRIADLEATKREIEASGGTATCLAVDVTDKERLRQAIRDVETTAGHITSAVFAAGLNVRERHWSTLDIDEFQSVIDTNLVAVANGSAAVLPGMRARGRGDIVVISSWAAWTHARAAGVAYSASKTALKALTENINDHEGEHGIRACHLCPGDVDTPFVDQRPVTPTPEQRRLMLHPNDVARAVAFVLDAPADVCINELVITPKRNQSYLRPMAS